MLVQLVVGLIECLCECFDDDEGFGRSFENGQKSLLLVEAGSGELHDDIPDFGFEIEFADGHLSKFYII